MKFNTSALFSALFGGMVLDAPAAPIFHQGRTQNRRLPRARIPGPRRPAGSKLARLAAEHRIGGRTSL